MRWHEPELHETRTVKRFAIFPIKIDGETRWLETVFVEQVYYPDLTFDGWYNYRFIDRKRRESEVEK